MLKQLVKNLISYTAREFAKAIVEEQLKQQPYSMLTSPVYIPSTFGPYEPADLGYEITWSNTSEENFHNSRNLSVTNIN